MTTCPMCAEEIQPTAKKCKHCGEILDKKVRSSTTANQFRQLAILVMIAIAIAAVWIVANGVNNDLSG